MKKCFKCNINLPLWLYTKNPKKYQNAKNKGRNYVCKICNYKEWVKFKAAWLWNTETSKYERVEFHTKKSILLYLIRK